MMRQKREEEGEEENRKEGGAAASSVKEVGETSWSFLTGIANFRQRFWVLRVSILTLNFPQNVGFYPPDLAFLDDNFRTRRRFFRQFFDGQKFKWERVELARSPYTFLATTPLPSVISKSCRLCPALLLLLLLLGRVRQRSNWQGRAACTGHWATNRPSQTDRQTDWQARRPSLACYHGNARQLHAQPASALPWSLNIAHYTSSLLYRWACVGTGSGAWNATLWDHTEMGRWTVDKRDSVGLLWIHSHNTIASWRGVVGFWGKSLCGNS